MKSTKKSNTTHAATYQYQCWNDELKAFVPVRLTAGLDGVTEEWIDTLNNFDHDEALIERYAAESKDLRYENFKASISNGDSGNAGLEEFNGFATRKTDPAELLFSEIEAESKDITKLSKAILSLTPKQIDLIYALYGEHKTCSEIAREEGVTEAAIRNRLKKILNRLKKLIQDNPD